MSTHLGTRFAALLLAVAAVTSGCGGAGGAPSPSSALPPAELEAMRAAVREAPEPMAYQPGAHLVVTGFRGIPTAQLVRVTAKVLVEEGIALDTTAVATDSVFTSVPMRIGRDWVVYRVMVPPLRDERTRVWLEGYFVDPVARQARRFEPRRDGDTRGWIKLATVARELDDYRLRQRR